MRNWVRGFSFPNYYKLFKQAKMGNRVLQVSWSKKGEAQDIKTKLMIKQFALESNLTESEQSLGGVKHGKIAVDYEISGLRLLFWTQYQISQRFKYFEDLVRSRDSHTDFCFKSKFLPM